MASVRRALPLPPAMGCQPVRSSRSFPPPRRDLDLQNQSHTGSKSCRRPSIFQKFDGGELRRVMRASKSRWGRRVIAAHAKSDIFRPYVLTFNRVEVYITRTRRTVRVTARWRACEAPHFSRQDSFRLQSEARGFDAPGISGGWDYLRPGLFDR